MSTTNSNNTVTNSLHTITSYTTKLLHFSLMWSNRDSFTFKNVLAHDRPLEYWLKHKVLPM